MISLEGRCSWPGGYLQKPFGSGFSATSTSTDVINGIDLTGKIAIVTGGNTGIGLETTKTLATAGATVIVPARDVEKAKKNLAGITGVEIEHIDLFDLKSVDGFAEKFLSSGRPLHLLINNAGIMFVPLRRDAHGNESQLVTNYLAPFKLTAKLWPALTRANGARVVNLSSQGHQFAPFNFEDPNFERREYETLSAYGQSKTAVNLFSLELDNRGKQFGVRSYSVHPGNIWGTELVREAPLHILQNFGFYDQDGQPVQHVIDSLKNIPQGAATTLWSATSKLLDHIGGVYCEDSDIAPIATGKEISSGVKSYSLEESSAKRLWALSEKMSATSFNINVAN